MGVKTPWIPSPLSAVREALRLAAVGPCDVVYDLGAGDGRVVILAVRDYGARLGVGIELDPLLAEAARIKAKMDGVADRVRIVEEDFFRVDLSKATVVYMYLYGSINEALRPKLEAELKPGARVVTLDFPVPGWVPVAVRRFRDENDILRTVHLYVIGVSDGKWVLRQLKPIKLEVLKAYANICKG